MPDNPLDNSQISEPAWAKDPRYVAVVKSLYAAIPKHLQPLIDTTDCFGLFTVEGEGPCPEAANCPIMTFCKQSWQLVHVRAAAAAAAPLHPKEEDPAKEVLEQLPWEDVSPKHKRLAYEDQGRLVDRLLDAFLEVFADLPKLPANWHSSHLKKFTAKYGKYLVSATPSFHTVRREETILVRFWTNNSRWPLVDIVPEMLDVMTEASETLGNYIYGPTGHKQELRQLDPPVRQPDSVWWKVRPCTHRMVARTQTASRVIGHAVRTFYRF